MSLHTETHRIQSAMATFILKGKDVDIPGADKDGLLLYRKLVHGVINDALETSFPITRDYLDAATWEEMTDDFMANHRCRSYQLWNIAGEFHEYALKRKTAERLRLPVLNDLLQFEWAETELYNMKNKAMPEYGSAGDLFSDTPVFNPEFKIFRFTYPVHLLHPAKAAANAGEYYLLMFRDPDDGRIHFIDITAWHVWLMEQMTVYARSPEQALIIAQSLFPAFDTGQFRENAEQFLQHLRNKKFLLGFRPAEAGVRKS